MPFESGNVTTPVRSSQQTPRAEKTTQANTFKIFQIERSLKSLETMPKVSERQLLLDDLEETMKFAKMDEVLRDDDCSTDEENQLLDQESSSSDDDMLETPYGMAASLHFQVSNQRFLKRRRLLDRSRDYIYNYFLNQPDDEFRKITRVTRETFDRIVHLIESDVVFSNESRNKQAPIHWQLACALDRLGNDGQGVSHARSKLIWGIGQGTVHLYTKRVVRALCNLNERFIQWPEAVQRAQISRRMAAKGFKDAVGFVDGTTIPLHKKPAVSGNVFMDRKKRYSVNAQIVCDDRYRIIYFKTGQPGSVGDSRAFSSTRLVREPERAFSPGQYLIGDSAYAATAYLIPAYKENQRDNREDRQEPRKIERFNTYLAKARVVNEHTIGILKSRWTCLKGMRIDIHEDAHMYNFIHQAVACVVLHNICLDSDPWDEEASSEDDQEENEVQELPEGGPRRALSVGQQKRMEVRNACLAFHDRV